MKRSLATATIAASLIGGGAVAVTLAPQFAGAQEESTTTTTPDAGTTEDGAREALPSWVQDTLDELVASGVIDQAQADQVGAALLEAAPDHRGGRHGHGPGPGGFGLRGGLESAATAIGIDEEALRDGLVAGQTLAEIAEANGVDPQTVIDALVAEATARIDEKLAEGDIDEATAADMKAGLTDVVTSMVNGELPDGPLGGFGGPGGRGGHHHGPFGGGRHDADDESTDDATEGTDTPSVAGSSADDVTAA